MGQIDAHPPSKLRIAAYEGFAEALGTFILIIIGNGTGGASVTGSGPRGSWEAGIVWGVGVLCGILASGFISGGHLNPAVTLGMAAGRRMPLWKVFHYIAGQLLGACAAASIIYSFFFTVLPGGSPQANLSQSQAFSCVLHEKIAAGHGFYIEWFITGLLLLIVCCVGDTHSPIKDSSFYPPFVVSLFVAVLIACFGPLTGACLNPARDFGPRLATLFFGLGTTAFPGQTRNPFWVFLVGPTLGGITGVLFWSLVGSRLNKFATEQKNFADNKFSTGDESLLTPIGDNVAQKNV